MPGDRWGAGPVIDHHIGVIAQAPQSVHPVQVLLMGAAVVGEDIYPPPAVTLDSG